MSELIGVFDDGEYISQNEMKPRRWHTEFTSQREAAILAGNGSQNITALFGGTGCGKTYVEGMAAADSLNSQRVRRVVVCVPNNLIAKQTQNSFRKNFGIHLAIFNSARHRNGVTSDKQGYVATYASIASNAEMHRRITTYERTLAIFDEVHHLGDGKDETWGRAAQHAFESVPEILAMTGSPFRPKGSYIPFVNYVPTDKPGILRFQADYSYPLGRAIVDGYCREPIFKFSDDGIVKIPSIGGEPPFEVSFTEDVSDAIAALRLQAGVKHGSPIRHAFLRYSLAEIRKEGRKCVIFLGGDTAGKGGTPTEDATKFLPEELKCLGYTPDQIMVITMSDKNPVEKLKAFRKSKTAWILITVNMVSEGADAPEISAAIFLTTWVSTLSFIQRVGRAIRFMGTGDPAEANIYLLHHPDYKAAATDIKKEIEAEAVLFEKRKQEERERNGDGPRRRTEAEAISGGDITYVVINGASYPALIAMRAEQECERLGVSKAYITRIIKDMMNGGADGLGRAV